MSDHTEALRKLADFLDENPLIAERVTVHADGMDLAIFTDGWSDPKQDKREVASLIKALGGRWDKAVNGDTDEAIRFEQEGALGFRQVRVYANRQATCVRRVVATEDVVVPAVRATPKRTVRREIVEWDCGPLLAGAAS